MTNPHTENNFRDDIDALAQQVLNDWDIPGLSLSIVHKGHDVKVKGYGVKKKSGTEPVNLQTLFQICSLTKSFTGTLLNMLVEEGVLDWEVPICHYMPSFKIHDPVAQNLMTLRDLISHRTGFPGSARQSWRLWWNTKRSSKEILDRIIHEPPTSSIRSHFSYDNVPYLIASEVAAHVTGLSWKQLCEEKIFTPLGMSRTSIENSYLHKDSNVAYPHRATGKHPVPWDNWDSLAAAAGISSNAEDMTKWLKFCLSKTGSVTYPQKPQTFFEVEGFFEPPLIPLWSIFSHEQPLTCYGLGWMIYNLNGRIVNFHTGLIDGMQSILAIVPDENLGICILTNQTVHLGAVSFLNLLLDKFLNLEPIDWSKKSKNLWETLIKTSKEERIRLESLRSKLSVPSLPLEYYVGEYSHPAYGSIFIDQDNEQLKIRLFSHEEGELRHWDKDQFEIIEFASASTDPWLIDFKLENHQKRISGLNVPVIGFFEKKSLKS